MLRQPRANSGASEPAAATPLSLRRLAARLPAAVPGARALRAGVSEVQDGGFRRDLRGGGGRGAGPGGAAAQVLAGPGGGPRLRSRHRVRPGGGRGRGRGREVPGWGPRGALLLGSPIFPVPVLRPGPKGKETTRK